MNPSRIVQQIDSPRLVIFVQGSWEIGDNPRNLAASQRITEAGLASTILYESSRNWKALENASNQAEWIAAFGQKTYDNELAELNDMIAYAKKEKGAKEIFLSGSSFGGGLAALVSASASRLLLAAPQIYCPPEKRVSIYQGFPQAEQFFEAITKFSGKLRIIHGDRDETISTNQSAALYDQARTKDKRLVLLPGNHTFTDNIEGYVQEHLDFFR